MRSLPENRNGEAKCFTDIDTGYLTFLAFETDKSSLSQDAVGYAYDQYGAIKYELSYDKSMGRWVWE